MEIAAGPIVGRVRGAARGSIMPIASAIVLIVLQAVNIAPQVPLPGITLRSISSGSGSEIRPASLAAGFRIVQDRQIVALDRPGP